MRESSQAREAYERYLSLGPQRSLAKVGQALGKSTTILERWSSAHGWQERIAAHERTIAAEREAEDAERRKQAREARLGIAANVMSESYKQFMARAKEGKLTPQAALAALSMAFETQRKDLGEPDQRIEHSGNLDVDVTDARQQLAGRLARIAARLGADGGPEQPL